MEVPDEEGKEDSSGMEYSSDSEEEGEERGVVSSQVIYTLL